MGLGLIKKSSKFPTLIESLSNVEIKQIATGYHHSMAVDSKSCLYCWGSGWSGQLGTGNTSDLNEPSFVELPNLSGEIIDITAGYHHSMALTNEGKIYSWGTGEIGQLGHGSLKKSNIPKILEITENFVKISASENHNLALNSKGNIFSWGYNQSYQLGYELDNDKSFNSFPKRIKTNIKFTKIDSGSNHSFGISNEGYLYCWGRLILSNEIYKKPQLISTQPFQNITFSEVSALSNHCVAISSNGEIWSFGYNEYGQCGQSDIESIAKLSPVEFLKNKKFKYVASGGNYSLALLDHENTKNEPDSYSKKSDSSKISQTSKEDKVFVESLVHISLKEIKIKKQKQNLLEKKAEIEESIKALEIKEEKIALKKETLLKNEKLI